MSNLFGQSVYNFLPPIFRSGDEETRSDVQRFLEALDLYLDEIQADTIDVIRSESRVETASDASLRSLAWDLGFRTLPNGAFSNLRQLLVNSTEPSGSKGDFDTIIDTIFITTGMIATIYSPWRDPDFLIVGESEIGEAEVGLDYKSNYLNSFTVGTSAVGGGASVGDKAVNPRMPYTFYVDLLFEPTAERLNVLNWTVNRFKRAFDKFVVRWPTVSASACWTIGESTDSTEPVNRILFADGTTASDSTTSFDGTNTNASKIGIDTIICLGCFIVGESPIGGAEICDASDPDIYLTNWVKGYAQRRRWF